MSEYKSLSGKLSIRLNTTSAYQDWLVIWSVFVVCLFGVSSWLVCLFGVPLWSIFFVSLFGLSSSCASLVYLDRVPLCIFIVCLFRLCSWCASFVCFHGVPLWSVFIECLFDLSSWWAYLVYLHGVSLLSVFMVSLFGLSSRASWVYVHDGPLWDIFMVSLFSLSFFFLFLFCLCSWCPSLVYLHVPLGSMFMVGLHSDYRRGERPLRRDLGEGDPLNSLCLSSACSLRSAVA